MQRMMGLITRGCLMVWSCLWKQGLKQAQRLRISEVKKAVAIAIFRQSQYTLELAVLRWPLGTVAGGKWQSFDD
jgi:hypothetical protein